MRSLLASARALAEIRRASWAVLVLCAGCSAVVSPDVDGLGDPPKVCTEGTSRECACLGGGSGTQRCNAGGSYDACACGQAGSGG